MQNNLQVIKELLYQVFERNVVPVEAHDAEVAPAVLDEAENRHNDLSVGFLVVNRVRNSIDSKRYVMRTPIWTTGTISLRQLRVHTTRRSAIVCAEA